MGKLKKLTEKFFKPKLEKAGGNGLYATLEELTEQRRFVPYLKNHQFNHIVSSRAGDVKSAFKGRGMELEEIRSYAFGDDVRDIDWRVTARRQTPYTKLFAEEKDREIYVVLDLSAHMVFGTRVELKSVAAAKIAALFGWLSLENRDRFGCLIYDGEETYVFKPAEQPRGYDGCSEKNFGSQRPHSETVICRKSGKAAADFAEDGQKPGGSFCGQRF